MKKQELGPLQSEWVERLRAHPEKQSKCQLGKKDDQAKHGYKACCLGECSMMLTEKGLDNGCWSFLGNWVSSEVNGGSSRTDLKSYRSIGLRDCDGNIDGCFNGYDSISAANDNDKTWLEIADFIEANPNKVFTKSV